MNESSIDRLHELFRLDAETGKLYWRIKGGSRKQDAEAGSGKSDGYRQIELGGKQYLSHRVVFAMTHGRWPTDQVDHISGIRADNRPENLREATRAQNLCNARIYRNNTSGAKGVRWNKKLGKWHARITVETRQIHLGVHTDIELAELIVAEARRKYHGEFARHA